ncbi:MAG: recombinase family protein [Bacillota bacterium]
MPRAGASERLKASAGDAVNPRKIAIYIRWSTEDQGDGTTLEVQRRNCELYVQSQGWHINPDLIFIDEGFSGGNLERPGLGRLRQAIKKGAVDVVVVYKLDRLSRNVLDTVNLVLDEWEGRCHLKSATQSLDTRDPLGKQFFYLLVGFAEYERQVIKERTFSGKLSRAGEGKNPGIVPPYGFTKGPAPGSFQVIPEEIEVVQSIFAEALAGAGPAVICKRLNDEGIPYKDHRNGKTTTWKEVTVRYMLKNPLYTGRLVYGQSKVQSRPRPGEPLRTRPDTPLVETEAILFGADGSRLSSPPVAVEEFEELQRRMAARAQRKTSNRVMVSEHLLTGILRCPVCGLSMFGRKKVVQPNGATYSPAYYVCEGMKSRGTCSNSYIRQDDLDAEVVRRLLGRYGDGLQRRRMIENAQAETLAKLRQVECALEEVRQDLAQHDLRLSELREEYVQRKLTLDEYRDFKGHVDREYEERKERETRLLGQLEVLQEALRADDGLEALAARLDAWDGLTLEQKKALLAEFIVKVTAYRKKGAEVTDVEIVWRQGVREEKEALSVS